MGLSAGTKLGPYEIVGHLGAGGMGEVYRARDPRVGREVAIKLIAPEHFGNNSTRARFRREAKALSRLSHPNVATLFEFDSEDGMEFLVMELVEGSSLRTKLRAGPLAMNEFFALAIQLSKGLDGAHAVGIVHRDLKPENLMVTPQGHLKILDFGLAKSVVTGRKAGTKTDSFASESHGAPGTLPYMAPEQLRSAPADHRLDIYAAGAVLYEMAAGRSLYEERGAMLVDAILNREATSPGKVNPQLPRRVSEIILKALEKDPKRRYQSARALASDLESAQDALSRPEAKGGSRGAQSSLKQPVVIGFGVYEVDLRARELRKHGVRIKLQEKPLAVLTMLLEHEGKLVTRKELSERLWGTDTFVDFDHSLGIAINKLRSALNDTASNPRFIETLARRGYRFIAPVRKESPPQKSAGSDKKRIAVLPLENQAKDPEQEYLADGLTEELISQLGRISPATLSVIARASAMRYKNTEKGIRQIGSELAADYVVEGTVRRSGARLRISVELVQVADETQMWSSIYDRPVKNVFMVEAEVAEQIAKALAMELVPQRPQKQLSANNLKAYELYLQGRHHWEKRTDEGFSAGFELFRRAVEADPSFELPYLGLADCYAVFGFYGTLPPKEAYEKAKSAALTAISINEQLSEAHSSLGFATLEYDWDWLAAEKSHQRAIAINPSSSHAYHWYGLNLTQIGRFKEAAAALEKARELDPLSVAIPTQIGWLLYFSRRYPEAMAELQGVLRTDAQFVLARYFLGMAMIQNRMHEDAIRELQRAVTLSKDHPACVAALALAYSLSGKRSAWQKTFDKLAGLAKQRHVSPYYMAFALAASSKRAEIFDWLERGYEERSGWLIYLKIEPAFDALKSDARFVEITQRADPFSPQKSKATAGA